MDNMDEYGFMSGLSRPSSTRVYGDGVVFEVQAADITTYFDAAMDVSEDGGHLAIIRMIAADDRELRANVHATNNSTAVTHT